MEQRRLRILLLTAISAIRIGMGYFLSVAGPNLLFLAHNVRVSMTTLSFVFLAGSIGVVIGSFICASIKKRFTTKQLYPLSLMSMILALLCSATPWINVFWLLFLGYILGGICFGYLDAGLQAIILDMWEETESRTFNQLYHLMYSVGASLAPLVAKAFLVENPKTCGHHAENVTQGNFTLSPEESSATFDGNAWSYYILTGWLAPAAMALFLLAWIRTEDQLLIQGGKKPLPLTERKDDSLRDIIWIFIPLSAYFFCTVGMDNVIHNFLHSVVLCSDLSFTVAEASYVNSLQWLSLGIGRLVGVFAAKHIRPKTIIVGSLIVSTCASIIVSVFGEQHEWIVWVVAFVHGFSTAPLYPSGVSWISSITNVAGRYIFIFNLGSSIGALSLVPLAGFLFDMQPFYVMYLLAASTAATGVCYIFSVAAAKTFVKNKDRKSYVKTDVDTADTKQPDEKHMLEDIERLPTTEKTSFV